MVSYLYSIQNHFPNHKIASDKLLLEIQTSVITIACDGIITDETTDAGNIIFKAELSSEQKLLLDSIIYAHDGVKPQADDSQILSNIILQNTVLTKTYSDFISIVNSKGILLQYDQVEIASPVGYKYYLFAFDGSIKYQSTIYLQTEITDFETNYKSLSNKPLDIRESGTGITKVKPRPVEGTMAVVSVYCQLGNPETLDPAGNPHYRVITTTPGVTEIRFKPNYGYYITGGYLKLRSDLNTSFVKCNFIFAPDFPPEYGGGWSFINNLKLDNSTREFKADVPPKYIKYYVGIDIASELSLKIFHDVNEHAEIEMRMDIYI